MPHNNDKAQLNQWYNDLTARLAKTHETSHSVYVQHTLATILAIGRILDRDVPVIDFRTMFGTKRKR